MEIPFAKAYTDGASDVSDQSIMADHETCISLLNIPE